MRSDIDYSRLVRDLRSSLGLTQRQLAERLDVSFATVNGWENARHAPLPSLARTLVRMAREEGIETHPVPPSPQQPGSTPDRRRP